MAFLHRVANGGGTVDREYAIGSDRMDICLRYRKATPGIELKAWRNGRPDLVKRGLEQLDKYLARLGLETGWLVIVDHRQNQPPIEERTRTEANQTMAGRIVTVIRA